MTTLFNTKRMTGLRRKLRRNAPRAEILLWSYLKRRQVGGYKFRRQTSISGYVVDFYCPALRLAIEVDGPSHFRDQMTIRRDQWRQRCIEGFGVHFFRITNCDVYNNIDGVIQALYNRIDSLK